MYILFGRSEYMEGNRNKSLAMRYIVKFPDGFSWARCSQFLQCDERYFFTAKQDLAF